MEGEWSEGWNEGWSGMRERRFVQIINWTATQLKRQILGPQFIYLKSIKTS